VTTTGRSPLLDALRAVGDPSIETVEQVRHTLNRDWLQGHVRSHGVAAPIEKDGRAERAEWLELLSVVGNLSAEEMTKSLISIEPDKLVVGQKLFARYGTEISGALLLAALPQTYAAEEGARVLAETERLQSDLRRRIRGTAQFLVLLMPPPAGPTAAAELWNTERPLDDDASTLPPWAACAALRVYHESVRRDIEVDHHPLNQADLIGTLLTFTIAVFEVLERLDIRWSEDEQLAYLHTWDVVGAHLGIGSPSAKRALPKEISRVVGDWIGLRPPTLARSRQLLDLIRDDQWRPRAPGEIDDNDWQSGRAGRLLAHALLDELAVAMPRRMRSWPIGVMRQLAPGRVRDRLGLGASGVLLSTLGALPKRQAPIGRFTSGVMPNRLEATVLRTMLNEVTRRTMVHFLSGGRRFVIPGLEAWSDGFVDD
jgi:hypothetical protein